MFEVHEYYCSYCGHKFHSKEACLEHEREHRVPESIELFVNSYPDSALFPSVLKVRFDTGEVKTYRLDPDSL